MNTAAQQDIDFLKRDISSLEAQLTQTKQALLLSESKLSEDQMVIQDLDRKQVGYVSQIESLKSEKNGLREDLLALEGRKNELARKSGDLDLLKERIANLEVRVKKEREERERAEREVFNLGRRMEERQREEEEWKRKARKMEEEAVNMGKERDELQKVTFTFLLCFIWLG